MPSISSSRHPQPECYCNSPRLAAADERHYLWGRRPCRAHAGLKTMLSLSSFASARERLSSSSGLGGNPPLSEKDTPGANVATCALSCATVCVWFAFTILRLPSPIRTCNVVVGAPSSSTSASDGTRACCARFWLRERAIASCSSSLSFDMSTAPPPLPPPPPPRVRPSPAKAVNLGSSLRAALLLNATSACGSCGSGGGWAGSTQLDGGAPWLRGAGGGHLSPLTMKTVQLSETSSRSVEAKPEKLPLDVIFSGADWVELQLHHWLSSLRRQYQCEWRLRTKPVCESGRCIAFLFSGRRESSSCMPNIFWSAVESTWIEKLPLGSTFADSWLRKALASEVMPASSISLASCSSSACAIWAKLLAEKYGPCSRLFRQCCPQRAASWRSWYMMTITEKVKI
mmetsp:Transcript_26308/g.52807  ORF Transcript_26308/g.52807 Transcript_26308/m.52807 type:complete len:400 (-) Transcript_26308:64-1263(-)